MANNPPSESSAHIVLEVTAFDHRGEPLLRERRFEGRCADVGLTARARIDAAMAKAIEALLASITPVEITRRVSLDDADRNQRFILDVALDGNIARAREEMKSYIDKHPANARAIYNLAVLTEAMGQVQEALVLYDRALAMQEEPLYRRTRDAAWRFADLEAQTHGASFTSQ
jgi:tetratricopeptide (TPR) repeat protein